MGIWNCGLVIFYDVSAETHLHQVPPGDIIRIGLKHISTDRYSIWYNYSAGYMSSTMSYCNSRSIPGVTMHILQIYLNLVLKTKVD